MGFQPDEVIATRTRLRELVKEPSSYIADKDLDHVNEVARRFIEMSPFLVIATEGADGRMDLSPKGDPAGFVEVYDSKTLLVPDRLGNNRMDTFENLLSNQSIGLFFMIPDHTETLRISGSAKIILDRAAQERLAIKGRQPNLVLAVTVEQVFMHCSKCLVRSRLWNDDTWPERRSAPTLAEWSHSANAGDKPVEELQGWHDDDAKNRLY